MELLCMWAESQQSNELQSIESQIWKEKGEYNIRGSLIVNIDGNGDAVGAGFEPSERGLLMGDDEWSLGDGDRGCGQ